MAQSQAPSISALIDDPCWLPHRLDMGRRIISFIRLTYETLQHASFLDYRIESAAQGIVEVPISHLLTSIAQTPNNKPSFLFHTSYCCSTLLSRALEQSGNVLALREPEIIMGISNAYRLAQSQAELEQIHLLRDAILRLVARPHRDGERIVVKPTNAANNLAPILAASGAAMVALYGDLRGFLVSIIKKGDPCKTLIRQIYRVYAMDKTGVSVIPQRDALALTDLQIAALVWRHQIELFDSILSVRENTNVRSLDFRVLLARPEETIAATGAHLSLSLDDVRRRQTAHGRLFKTDAKDENRMLDAARRDSEERALLEEHAKTLDLIENWAFNLNLWPTKTKQLAQPLTI